MRLYCHLLGLPSPSQSQSQSLEKNKIGRKLGLAQAKELKQGAQVKELKQRSSREGAQAKEEQLKEIPQGGGNTSGGEMPLNIFLESSKQLFWPKVQCTH